MGFRMRIRRGNAVLLGMGIAAVVTIAGPALLIAQAGSALTIPRGQLIQPEELNKLLAHPQAMKPLILQVGSRLMFDQAHIKGAEYAGPAGDADGLDALRNRVSPLPRNSFIVIYCGCCPWNRCPNIGPAFKLLNGLGFSNFKVLYIGDDFGTDWVDKGYPAESAS
jgi:thiosulfate/3-mercaptopyruvate sulfurtransferase